MNCKEHQKVKQKRSYTAWHARAADSYRKGERQRQCSECNLWFWSWEMKGATQP